MNYFIADLHFGHQNALAFDARPFKTIEEHDQMIVDNWNDVVGIDDDVFILGDVSWHNVTKTNENRDFRSLFVEVLDYKEISFTDGKGVVLSHYPIPCFNHHYYGWYHLYGHVHNSFEWNMMKRVKYEMEELYDKPCFMFNVGAMINYMNYTPRTLEEILESNRK